MSQQSNYLPKVKKSRYGARGVRKVKTGCLTCKIRRKKCDEARPQCSTCIKANWQCDFNSSPPMDKVPPPIRNAQHPYAKPLLDDEQAHMEYFEVVCVREFSLYFELPVWGNIILQATLAEPALHHAALAIGSLTSSRYHPALQGACSVTPFAIRQYGLAIQALHARLTSSPQSLELAVLASVVFSLIEFLLGLDSQVGVHLQAGRAMLENLCISRAKTSPAPTESTPINVSKNISTNYDLLGNAIFQLTSQVNSFIEYRDAQRQILR